MLFYKLAESSYLKDFVLGMEPTGQYTFQSALKNKENHGTHKLIGDIGGFVSGAAATTTLSGLGMLAAGALTKKNPALSKMLTRSGKDMFSIFNPKKIYRAFKNYGPGTKTGTEIMEHSKEMLKKLEILENNPHIKNIKNIYDDINNSNIFTGLTSNLHKIPTKEAIKEIKQHAQELYDHAQKAKQMANEYKLKFNETPAESVAKGTAATAGLIAAGFGGLTNLLTTHTQYNAGRDLDNRLQKIQGKK